MMPTTPRSSMTPTEAAPPSALAAFTSLSRAHIPPRHSSLGLTNPLTAAVTRSKSTPTLSLTKRSTNPPLERDHAWLSFLLSVDALTADIDAELTALAHAAGIPRCAITPIARFFETRPASPTSSADDEDVLTVAPLRVRRKATPNRTDSGVALTTPLEQRAPTAALATEFPRLGADLARAASSAVPSSTSSRSSGRLSGETVVHVHRAASAPLLVGVHGGGEDVPSRRGVLRGKSAKVFTGLLGRAGSLVPRATRRLRRAVE